MYKSFHTGSPNAKLDGVFTTVIRLSSLPPGSKTTAAPSRGKRWMPPVRPNADKMTATRQR
jgi:hypothetical protein